MYKIICLFILIPALSPAQELYVFSEPASNMPSKSIGVRQSLKTVFDDYTRDPSFRHNTDIMFGMNKNLMLHAGFGFSDMYSKRTQFESVRFYAKYRFLSQDAMKKHFRMAAFGEVSHSVNKPTYEELSVEGDQSGLRYGIIATQLLHKLAVSATVSNIQVLQKERWNKALTGIAPFQAIDYSLSAGYLVLPKAYTSYKQTNLNLYLELLGQQLTDRKGYFLDIAPAAQLIFNSSIKLNMGYRWQIAGNVNRMALDGLFVSGEVLFLNALRKQRE
jgi:hypothetical protein